MKFKDGAEIVTEDFWYDLFSGGYIKPEKLLESPEDIQKVREAMKVLEDFLDSAEDQEVIVDM